MFDILLLLFGFSGFSLFPRLELLFLGLSAFLCGGRVAGEGVAPAVIRGAGIFFRGGVRGRRVISRRFVLPLVVRGGGPVITIAGVLVILADGIGLIGSLTWSFWAPSGGVSPREGAGLTHVHRSGTLILGGIRIHGGRCCGRLRGCTGARECGVLYQYSL